jgi:hypothetical protein
MTPFTLSRVGHPSVAPSLTAAKVRCLLRTCGCPEANQESLLTPGACLLLWTADLLARDSSLPHDQQELVVYVFRDEIFELARHLWESLEGYEESGKRPVELPSAVLKVLDHQFACVSGSSGQLDLREAKFVSREAAFLTMQAFDLTSIFLAYRGRMLKAQGS